MKELNTALLTNVKNKTPLVHHITNYVTVNDCANMVLACGGSPIMADDLTEVEEITSICQSLVINIGTLNQRTIPSMIAAGKKANELQHPILLDPVGVGASTLRTQTTLNLLDEITFSVIRGNISEIKAIGNGHSKTCGVDANIADCVTEDNLNETIAFAKDLSEKTKAIIVITGAIDLVVDQSVAYIIRNGHQTMAKITGTGCMLSSVIGTFIAANTTQMTKAAALAVAVMGRCGERANAHMQGTASFKVHLMDEMSRLDEATLLEELKVEIR